MDCDPEIIKSAEIVSKACIVEFIMDKYNGLEFINGKKISFPQNSEFSDEWMSDNDLKGKSKHSYPVIDKYINAAYVTTIQEGINYKKIINNIQDWLISTTNNQVAEDMMSETCTANTG